VGEEVKRIKEKLNVRKDKKDNEELN